MLHRQNVYLFDYFLFKYSYQIIFSNLTLDFILSIRFSFQELPLTKFIFQSLIELLFQIGAYFIFYLIDFVPF